MVGVPAAAVVELRSADLIVAQRQVWTVRRVSCSGSCYGLVAARRLALALCKQLAPVAGIFDALSTFFYDLISTISQLLF